MESQKQEFMAQNTNMQGEALQQVMAQAMVHGINTAFLFATIFAVIAVILALFIKKPQPITASVEEQVMNRRI